jgi:5-methyltetrahydrofolate--homocysteine methyltransferase
MILQDLSLAIQKGDRTTVTALVQEALSQQRSPQVILNDGLITGMDEVGRKFQTGEFFIPHMLLAARAMNSALEILKPQLVETGAKPAGKVLLGTVQGDHHDIGKNLVSMMLKGKGFDVIDIGIDTPVQKFVDSVTEDIDIVAMSALLSTTAPFLEKTIMALDKAGLRKNLKVMVGGGAVTQEYADRIGAEGYGRDAAIAAEKALELVNA